MQNGCRVAISVTAPRAPKHTERLISLLKNTGKYHRYFEYGHTQMLGGCPGYRCQHFGETVLSMFLVYTVKNIVG